MTKNYPSLEGIKFNSLIIVLFFVSESQYFKFCKELSVLVSISGAFLARSTYEIPYLCIIAHLKKKIKLAPN